MGAGSGDDREAEGGVREDARRPAEAGEGRAGPAGEVSEGVPCGAGGAAEADLPDAAGAAGEEHGVLAAAAVLGAAHGAAAAVRDAEAAVRDADQDAEGDGEVRGRDAAGADDADDDRDPVRGRSVPLNERISLLFSF